MYSLSSIYLCQRPITRHSVCSLSWSKSLKMCTHFWVNHEKCVHINSNDGSVFYTRNRMWCPTVDHRLSDLRNNICKLSKTQTTLSSLFSLCTSQVRNTNDFLRDYNGLVVVVCSNLQDSSKVQRLSPVRLRSGQVRSYPTSNG